jgi:hypothetical protein
MRTSAELLMKVEERLVELTADLVEGEANSTGVGREDQCGPGHARPVRQAGRRGQDRTAGRGRCDRPDASRTLMPPHGPCHIRYLGHASARRESWGAAL